MDRDYRMELIEAGQVAVGTLGLLRKPVEDAKNRIIGHLVALYRMQKTDHDILVGGIAEIAAMEGLISTLENQIQRSNLAVEKEFQDGS